MAILRWLCNKSNKKMVVKIVHRGGHKELHDRPVLASEIMRRNPKCVVAYPNVFHQPWAIVPPDTLLMLGQKFYVVPVSTVRKLQRHSLRRTPSPLGNFPISEDPQNGKTLTEEGCLSSTDKCLKKMLNGMKSTSKANNNSEATRSSSTASGSSETTRRLNRKRNNQDLTPSPVPDYWQPGLQSVTEES